MNGRLLSLLAALSTICFLSTAAPAVSGTFFDNGTPDGAIGVGSRPESVGRIEIEAADDFNLATAMSITSATFTGLITGGSAIGALNVEIYRVFPLDSNTSRIPNVPTRVNSPSDVAFDSRSTPLGTLSFSTQVVANSFAVANSILNGINKSPNQTTGGEGPVTGQEVKFTVNFATPFLLPVGHYFFVPQVQVSAPGEFFWLSSGAPLPPDLQGWIRNANLDPDWLRDGTDIVGGTARFNFAFSLDGEVITPLPAALPLFASGLGALGLLGWRRKRKAAALTA